MPTARNEPIIVNNVSPISIPVRIVAQVNGSQQQNTIFESVFKSVSSNNNLENNYWELENEFCTSTVSKMYTPIFSFFRKRVVSKESPGNFTFFRGIHEFLKITVF